eukprot:2802711-Rhodomonas_salina.3
MVLPDRCAMCGTDVAYGATSFSQRSLSAVISFMVPSPAMSSTDPSQNYAFPTLCPVLTYATVLRSCYVKCSTDLRYAASSPRLWSRAPS